MSRKRKYITSDRYCISKAFKFDVLCQKWPFLTKMVTFDKKCQIWPLSRHSNYPILYIFFFYSSRRTFWAIYHHCTIILKIWLYMAIINFQAKRGWGKNFRNHFFFSFFYITGLGAYLNIVRKWSEEKRGRRSTLIYIYI